VFLYSTIVVESVAVSLATSLLSWAHVVYPPPEVWNYGLPFVWRAVIFVASPMGTTAETVWTWFAFALDVLFFMAIGYLVVTLYQRRHRTTAIASPGMVLSVTYVAFVLWISIEAYLSFCNLRQCA